MYRIKLTDGEERTLESPDALTAAIRAGVVTADCTIFHQRAGQWLPIAQHPHYQRALAAATAPAPGPAPKPAAASSPAPSPAPAARAAAGPRTRVPYVPRTEAVRPQPPAPQPSVASAPTTPAEPIDLAETLELLELLPDPTPDIGESAEPVHLEIEPAGRTEPAGPTGLAEFVVDRASEPIAPAADVAPPAPEPLAPEPVTPAPAPEPPARPKRSREIEFVYVPEPALLRPKSQPAAQPAAPEPKAAASIAEPPVSEAPAAEPVPPREPAPMAMAPAAPMPEAPSAPAPREHLHRDVAHRELAHRAVADGELDRPAPLPDVFTNRSRHDIDLSPLDTGRGRRLATLGGAVTVVGLGVALLAWKPWTARAEAKPEAPTVVASSGATASPVASPAAMLAHTPVTPASTTIHPTAQPMAHPAADDASGFGGADRNALRNRTPRAAEAAGSSDSTRAAIPAGPAVNVPTVELGALPMSVAMPGGGSASGLPVSRSVLARNYAASYAAARAELATRLDAAGVDRITDRARLATTAGLIAGRRSVAEAVRAVKQYRQREAAIEQAYGDTLQLVGRKLGLSGDDLRAFDVRGGERESAESARQTDQMLAQADRLVGLLLAEDGHYQIAGDGIAFGDSSVASRYGELRSSLQSRSADSPTAQLLTRALAGARLPVERVQ